MIREAYSEDNVKTEGIMVDMLDDVADDKSAIVNSITENNEPGKQRILEILADAENGDDKKFDEIESKQVMETEHGEVKIGDIPQSPATQIAKLGEVEIELFSEVVVGEARLRVNEAPIKHIELNPNIPLDLESVWFVKVLDKNGDIQVLPCMFGFGEDCKTDEEVMQSFIDFSTGNVFHSANFEPFSVFAGFVSAHRWEKLDLETMQVKERAFDGDSEDALKYSVLTVRDDYGKVKCQHQYSIEINSVVSGRTKKMVVSDASKKSLIALQQENYKKYLGKATYNVYKQDFDSETNIEQVVQYAKEYTDRYQQMYTTKMKRANQEQNELGNAIEKREVNPFIKVNFDNLWFVTHVDENGKVLVSPCVLDGDKKSFIDYSTGLVYKAPKYVPFAMIEGYLGAYRWQQMELMTLNVQDREICRDLAAERYLEKSSFTLGNVILRPWNEYAISISGVVTAKDKVVAFLSDNPYSHSFRDFRVFNYKTKLGAAIVKEFSFVDTDSKTVKDVCEFAEQYVDRLNPVVKQVVPQMPSYELEQQIKKDKKEIKKQNKKVEKASKKEKEDGIFSSIKGFFTNRKYKKNKREIESILGKD